MNNFSILGGLAYQSLRARCGRKRMPVFVSLVLNDRCNMRCRYCYANVDGRFDHPASEAFTRAEVFGMVDELHSMGTRLIFLLGGEPLLHEDIGGIIGYIVSKGIVLHLITNGTLLEKKFEEARKAHVVCVSLDGPEKVNDLYRGQGTYKVIIDNIRFAVKNGLKIRIHPVLTKDSIKALPELVGLCEDLKLTLTYSPPNYLGETDFEDFRISAAEYKNFWAELIRLKKSGAPIGNSLYALEKALNWPIDYHSYMTHDHPAALNYKPVFCASGYTYAAIDSSGVMFNCINRGVKNGLDIRKVGIKRAWDHLLEIRKDCVSCATLNTIETSVYMNLSPEVWIDAIRYHLKFHCG